MEFHVFSSFSTTFVALFTGAIFGFLLQKARVGMFDTIVGQLMLRDFTVMKVILTAILVGGFGIYAFSQLGLVTALHISKTPLLFSALGGVFFGVGMSVTGYCPGTALVALAQGAKDMVFGVVGMLVGSLIYNEVFSSFSIGKDGFYQVTLSDVFHVPTLVILMAVGLCWILFRFGVAQLEKRAI